MGRIEEAAEELKRQQQAAEAKGQDRVAAAEEDLAEFVQLMRSRYVRPEEAYRLTVSYNPRAGNNSGRISYVDFEATELTGWLTSYRAPSEYSQDVWDAVLVSPDLALWNVRLVKLRAPGGGGHLDYTGLRPGQITLSPAFPRQELVVVMADPVPDTARHIWISELPQVALKYLATVE